MKILRAIFSDRWPLVQGNLQVLGLYRLLILCFFAGVSSSIAGPLDLDARANAVSSANTFGHARLVRPLGELSVGGGVNYPLKLVFNSNPSFAPGAFGPYWRIPLLASAVVQFKQYQLYWDGPHEYRQFFSLDRSYKSRRGEQVYIERGKDWKATVARNGEVLIEALDGSEWSFRYDEGQLEEFKLGASADLCRIAYSGRGLPLYITNQATSRRLFEIEYQGATDPERLIIGDQQVVVEMGDGELTAPDGTTNYRNYRVSFLRSLAFGEDEVEYYTYSKADKRKREIVAIAEKTKKKIVKTLDLAVNRVGFSSESAGEIDNWIEWEAKSGFITADSGSSYTVRNDSWDPNLENASFGVAPSAVDIARLPIDGAEQKWSYNWKSGVRVYTDQATGELVRRTTIMSEGPASGKLRKREVQQDGEWILDRQNSYDPKGRPIRAVHGDSMRIWKWEDSPSGSEATEYLNGSLVRRTVYGVGGEFIEREVFKENGDIDKYVYGATESGRSVAHYLNGEVVSYKELDHQKRLNYMKWANGKQQFWVRGPVLERFLTLFPDGREYLVERGLNGKGYEKVISPSEVADAVQFFTQTRNK